LCITLVIIKFHSKMYGPYNNNNKNNPSPFRSAATAFAGQLKSSSVEILDLKYVERNNFIVHIKFHEALPISVH
jgi:hypothetical protein